MHAKMCPPPPSHYMWILHTTLKQFCANIFDLTTVSEFLLLNDLMYRYINTKRIFTGSYITTCHHEFLIIYTSF